MKVDIYINIQIWDEWKQKQISNEQINRIAEINGRYSQRGN